MRPLSPAERAAILAEHPGTTDEDLDEFLAELAAEHAVEPGTEARVARRRAVRRNRFPRMAQAVEQVRRQEEEEGRA